MTSNHNSEKEKYESVWKHDNYRTFSPGEVSVDKVKLIDLLRQHGVKTVLDAGCGSGKLMHKLVVECGDEFDVHGFDIAENCLDAYFDNIKDEILTTGCLWNSNDFNKEYDAIVCTDVLEHIPTEHVPAVLDNIYKCTKKFCYLAIALFPDHFGQAILGEPLHLTVKDPEWWNDQLVRAGFSNGRYKLEKAPNGQNMWLHVYFLK